jgi:hypothetical protein
VLDLAQTSRNGFAREGQVTLPARVGKHGRITGIRSTPILIPVAPAIAVRVDRHVSGIVGIRAANQFLEIAPAVAVAVLLKIISERIHAVFGLPNVGDSVTIAVACNRTGVFESEQRLRCPRAIGRLVHIEEGFIRNGVFPISD